MKKADTDIAWFLETFAPMLKPPSDKPIDMWAEQNIRLPSNVSEPGRYSIERTPYVREWLQDMSPDSGINNVTVLAGAQIGKTQTMLCILGYYMSENPANQIYCFPNEGMQKDWIKLKLDPFIDANTFIKDNLGAPRKNADGNSMASKEYLGFMLAFAYAAAPNTLRSISTGIVLADEIDGYKFSEEGNPLSLLDKRMNTFGYRKKFMKTSTPVNRDSLIIAEYNTTDQRKYLVKCPHCGAFITLDFERMSWEGDENYVESAWINCPLCGYHVHNSDKAFMFRSENNPHWTPTREGADPTVRGYYLPSTYSPPGWMTFESIAKQYLQAKKKMEKGDSADMVSFYNTVLGKEYKVSRTRPDPSMLMQRGDTGPYAKGTVPSWVLIITTGSDVQGDRIETTVIGWGMHGRHYYIEHVVLLAPTEQDKTDFANSRLWDMWYKRIVHGQWEREDGVMLDALSCFIDCGYNQDIILAVTHDWGSVYPCKGVARIVFERPNMKESRTTVAGVGTHCHYWEVSVNKLKLDTYEWLLLEDDEEHTRPFYCAFPRDMGREFYDQLVSESFTEPTRTNKNGMWTKIRSRNEVLDCSVYATAAWFYNDLNQISDAEMGVYAETLLSHKMTRDEKKTMYRRGNGRRILNTGINL